MKLAKIRELVRLLEESGVEEIEVSSWGQRIRVSKSGNSYYSHAPALVSAMGEGKSSVGEMATKDVQADYREKVQGDLKEVKSPMVGTFYRAPAPGADPFVGQTICIIEAMKLMNEIQSEVSGRIARILVENAQPVEYGQTLFLVAPG
jgi:acetyl-CoA carboxylase biotin carboxyl carrier protein